MKDYTLVYQAGIANVFSHAIFNPHLEHAHTSRRRVLQSDFRTAESFCHGLQEAGARVHVAWCNEAGDITQSFWRFSDYDNAPFSDKFGWPVAREMIAKEAANYSRKPYDQTGMTPHEKRQLLRHGIVSTD